QRLLMKTPARSLNYRRVHSSINYQVPHHVHIQKGPQIKRWKNHYKPRQQKRDEQLEAFNCAFATIPVNLNPYIQLSYGFCNLSILRLL
ncbi:hypothetical protein, partial [Agriterribacter sp.]|uniref:hypothetical protein n=1 Tax=Agriterribacter sp. TaxID=2821509 RepID=UPI002C0940D2